MYYPKQCLQKKMWLLKFKIVFNVLRNSFDLESIGGGVEISDQNQNFLHVLISLKVNMFVIWVNWPF